MQIWMAWALAFFLCIATPAQAMSASKALANPLATGLDTSYYPINSTDPDGLQPIWLRPGALFSKPSVLRLPLGRFPSRVFRTVGEVTQKTAEKPAPELPNIPGVPEQMQPKRMFGPRNQIKKGFQAEEQLRTIRKAQDQVIKTGKDFKHHRIDELPDEAHGAKIIDKINKSEMRPKNINRRIRTQEDADWEYPEMDQIDLETWERHRFDS